ncbi:hypothetical protein ACWCQK_32675 [Streptomyces sp. NPDC002306]
MMGVWNQGVNPSRQSLNSLGAMRSCATLTSARQEWPTIATSEPTSIAFKRSAIVPRSGTSGGLGPVVREGGNVVEQVDAADLDQSEDGRHLITNGLKRARANVPSPVDQLIRRARISKWMMGAGSAAIAGPHRHHAHGRVLVQPPAQPDAQAPAQGRTGGASISSVELPAPVCQRSGQFGVVLIGVKTEGWGPHLVYGRPPVGPLHNPVVTLHEHGQVATASARARRLAELYASPLASRPEGTVAVGGQRLLRKRAAASLSDRLRHYILAVDPKLQLSSPTGTRWQRPDLKPIEHPSTLRGT